MTWADFQALFADQSQGISSQNISVPNLKLYMRMVLMKIASFYDWSFAIRTDGSVDTSSTSPVDLASELSDYKRLITVTGSLADNPYEWELLPTKDYELTVDGDGDYLDIRNKNLYLRTGTESSIPTTVNIVYFSNYLVESAAGVRKIAPTENDDVFVLPAEWEPILLDGLTMYLLRKEKKYAEYREVKKIFDESLRDMALKEPAKVSSALRGFRHYHHYLS